MGVRSLEGLPLEDHRRQRAAPNPYKAFNAILGRHAHWANCPNRTAVCQSLAPDRPESWGTTKSRPRRCKRNHGNHDP
ncbi:hypothetical protein PanWU01x14_255990 [Parasponia andersonii]|uniref:Uncharacterized protein n=1 Tax=Parasponia andersonii TaxID=3476 RepID=A0A2P5BAK7_PARAD|nr:hypothetical protein PanWU01x14_255990 [Parasponia andersonii]